MKNKLFFPNTITLFFVILGTDFGIKLGWCIIGFLYYFASNLLDHMYYIPIPMVIFFKILNFIHLKKRKYIYFNSEYPLKTNVYVSIDIYAFIYLSVIF